MSKREGYRSQDSLPGVNTWRDENNAKGIPRDPGGYHPVQQDGGAQDPSGAHRRERALPADDGQDNEVRRPAQPVYNAPGPSNSNPSGNLHKDKVRTKGQPGEQYSPQPIDQSKGQFRRRTMDRESESDLDAGQRKPFPSAGDRQKRQKSRAKIYYQKYYKRKRGRLKAKARLRYKRIRNRGWKRRDNFFRDRAKYESKYTRRPGGGYSNPSDRRKDWEKGKKRTPLVINRKKKNDPGHGTSKSRGTRLAGVYEFPEIPLYIDPPSEQEEGRFGYICRFDDETDMVEFCPHDADPSEDSMVLPLEEFLDCTTFLSEEDLDEFFGFLDDVYEYAPSDVEVASRYLSDSMGVDEMTEPSPERVAEFYRDQVWNRQRSDDSREQRSTPGADDTTKNDYEGLPSWMGPIKDERENPTPAHGNPVDRERPGAPGSAKVIPRGTGFVGRTSNRQIVAAKMAEILGGTAPSVHERSQTLTVKMHRVVPKSAMWLFNVSGGESSHRVRLQAIRKGNNKTLSRADVRISCDCNFWRWQGPEHWAKAGGYLYGRPVGTASTPVVRDPNGQHMACKHVLAVLKKAADYRFRSRKEVDRAIARSRELNEKRRGKTAMDTLVSLLFPSVGTVAQRYLARRQD